jgi:Flp pilus assembly protein TadG
MIRRSARSRPRTRGQSLVEFAIVIPVFLLILFAIFDFGVLLYSRMTVINAAREAARAATLLATPSYTPGQIQSVASARASAAAGGLPVTTTATCGACDPGDFVTVTVTYDHSMFFPLLFGNTIPMSSTVQMVLEETGVGS